MKRAVVSSIAVACTAALALVVVPEAASASNPDASFTFADLDTSTPGHVTGTVASTQPYVWVRLASNVPAVKLTLENGSAGFDLETWGYGEGPDGTAHVQGVACPADPPTEQSCSGVTTSDAFTPNEITPDVTWFADDTVGPDQDVQIAVEDHGGGTLQAIFVRDGGAGSTAATLDQHGTTTLDLADGDGYVWIRRCATANVNNCSELNFTHELHHDLHVHRAMSVEIPTVRTVAKKVNTSKLDLVTSRAGTYTVNLRLVRLDPDTGELVTGSAGPSRTTTGTLVDGVATNVPVLVPVSKLVDGTYVATGTITVVDPDYGTYTDIPVGGGLVTVDRTGPSLKWAIASPRTIYPRINNAVRRGSSTVTFTGTLDGQELLEIRNSDGAVVARPKLHRVDARKATVVWKGAGADGKLLPKGTYVFVLTDQLGNATNVVARVTLSRQRLVTKTFKHPVTAQDGLVGKYVGKCSQLVRPATRGWISSLGFYANTRCGTTTWNASAVSTLHRRKLPTADTYLSVRIDTYGGARPGVPGSEAVIRYLTTKQTWVDDRILGSKAALHTGATRSAKGMIDSDRYLYWGVATAYGNQYDVAKFTIVVRYTTLG